MNGARTAQLFKHQGLLNSLPSDVDGYSLPGVMSFLNSSFHQFEVKQIDWDNERTELKYKISTLEGERDGLQNLQHDLMNRIKILEDTLKGNDKGETTSDQIDNISTIGSTTLDTWNVKHTPKKNQDSNMSSKRSPSADDTIISSSSSTSSRSTKTRSPSNIIISSSGGISPSNHRKVKSRTMPAEAFKKTTRTSSKNILRKWLAEFGYGDDTTTEDNSSHDNTTTTTNTTTNNNSTTTSTTNKPSSAGDISATMIKKTEKKTVVNNYTNGLKLKLALLETDPVVFSPLMKTKKEPITIHLQDLEVVYIPDDRKSTISTSSSRSNRSSRSTTSSSRDLTRSKSKTMPSQFRSNEEAMRDMVENMTDEELDKLYGSSTSTAKKAVTTGGSVAEDEDSGKSTKRIKLKKRNKKTGAGTMMLDKHKTAKLGTGSGDIGAWMNVKIKLSARSHLDAVRGVAWHSTLPLLLSASEDYTVKLWNMDFLQQKNKFDTSSKSSRKTMKIPKDVAPLCTYRGHVGSVYCVDICQLMGVGVSGGADGIIYVWELPDNLSSSKNIKNALSAMKKYKGHDDAIWSISCHPNLPEVLSASADGSIGLWFLGNNSSSSSSDKQARKGRYSYHIQGDTKQPLDIPSSIAWNTCNPNTFISSHVTGNILLWDKDTTDVPLKVFSSKEINTSVTSQYHAYKIAIHPTLPLVISAHEDRRIRFWNTNTGQLDKTLVAHQDAVTSVSIDKDGLFFVSTGHDCSLRVWNLDDNPRCMQELSLHTKKTDEGIHDSVYHQSYGWIATAGADSIIKVIN